MGGGPGADIAPLTDGWLADLLRLEKPARPDYAKALFQAFTTRK